MTTAPGHATDNSADERPHRWLEANADRRPETDDERERKPKWRDHRPRIIYPLRLFATTVTLVTTLFELSLKMPGLGFLLGDVVVLGVAYLYIARDILRPATLLKKSSGLHSVK